MHYLIRTILIAGCLIGLASWTIFGQDQSEPLFIIRVEGKSGFIDRTGKIIIKPIFENVQEFEDDRAPAQIEKKWGFIDRSGKFIIEPVFDEIRWSFSEGLTPVLIGSKWGYIDESGKIVIEPSLEYGHRFREGRAVINIGRNETLSHGLINLEGKLVTDKKFNWSAWSFSEGLLSVRIGDKWGFVDLNGEIVIPIKYKEAKNFSEGMASVCLDVKGKNTCGFIDKTENFVIPAQFEECWYFSEGLAAFKKNGKYGFINKKGEIVIKPAFDWLYSFTEGLAAVKKNGKWGFINKNGRFVISPQYDQVWSFRNGLASISFGKWEGGLGYHVMSTYNGKWGYIDKTGAVVWEPTK